MAGSEADGTAGAGDAAVFRYSRKGQLLGLAGVVTGGLVTAFLTYDQAEPVLRWSGLGLSLVLIGTGLFFMLKPFDPRRYADHTLTIDREGIECGRLYTRKVPWEAISYAHVLNKRDPDRDFLVVGVHDTELYPPAQGKMQRVASFMQTLNSVSMDLDPLDGTGSQVDAALDRFRPSGVGSVPPRG